MEGREAACADGACSQMHRLSVSGTLEQLSVRNVAPPDKKRFLFFCFGGIIFV